MALPLSFVVIVGLAILIAGITRDHILLIYTELICITVIPTLIQWSIGDMNSSGLVIAWSLVGPIGAVMFLSKRSSVLWLALFIGIVIVSVVYEPQLLGTALPVSKLTTMLFYIMNLGAASVVVFFAAFYFVSELVKQKSRNAELLEVTQEKNIEITDSIRYAQNIQRAILPADEEITKVFPNHFVFFKPRDIVSGDFYWYTHKDGKVFIAVCDCTGHGVPGAFVSMIGNDLLNHIILEKEVSDPGEILSHLNNGIKRGFTREGQEQQAQDGMDIVLCVFDETLSKLEFAGAKNNLLIVHNGEIDQIKGDKSPIGGEAEYDVKFTTHQRELASGDAIYLMTDGYPDQFGGPREKKFMIKRFKEMLLGFQHKDMLEQLELIDSTLTKWKGEVEQVDDICIIGITI